LGRLFLRHARALAISITAMLSFVSLVTAAPAIPLKVVHDTLHKALRDRDLQADLESHTEYGLAAVASGGSRYCTAAAVKPSEVRYTLTLVEIGRVWKVVVAYHISIMPNSAQPLPVILMWMTLPFRTPKTSRVSGRSTTSSARQPR